MLVLIVCSILAVLVGTVVRQSLGTQQTTANDSRGDVALAAADAGVSRYLARLVASPRYYDLFVDQAEDTRVATSPSGTYGPGSAWPQGRAWTYSTTANPSWTPVHGATERYGAAEYSVRITPPPSGKTEVTIQSTGRVVGSGASPKARTVQARVRPSSLSDFQAISEASISYGSTARTTGQVYSEGSVRHDGTAEQPVFAIDRVTGSGDFQRGYYDSTTNPTTRTLYPSGIPFAQFDDDFDDIEAAAASQGNSFDASDARGWLVQFGADSRVTVYKITSIPSGKSLSGTYLDYGVVPPRLRGVTDMSGYGIACSSPITRTTSNYTLLWFEQPAVVGVSDNPCITGSQSMDSVVDGRITLASGDDLIVGGNIAYETSGDDVLGLIARNDVLIASYAPSTLTWRAATLAQSGQWKTVLSDGSKNTMNYTGSQAMYNGGSAGMFDYRNYLYDETLVYQRPPLYPTISGTWKTLYWREVTPNT